MTTMLIGQAPSRDTEGGGPFSGATGRRIAGMAKMSPDALSRHYGLGNALDYHPGDAAGGGDAFPKEAARAGVQRLIEQIKGTEVDRLIFVGRGVAEAFGLDPDAVGGYLRWFRTAATGPRVWLAILPHPSGLNRWYNDAENRYAAALFLQTELRTRGGAPTPATEVDADEQELRAAADDEAMTSERASRAAKF